MYDDRHGTHAEGFVKGVSGRRPSSSRQAVMLLDRLSDAKTLDIDRERAGYNDESYI